MPSNTPSTEQDSDLPPPGSRWGTGAQSVLPYLTRTLQAKPASGAEARDSHVPQPHPSQEPQPTHPA